MYHVSLSVRRPPDVDDAELIGLLHAAVEHAACVPVEIMPRGLIVEAERVAVQALGAEMRASNPRRDA